MKILLTLMSFFLSAFQNLMGEEYYLHNVEQLTFTSMGFEKAGEAYFSPDGNTIIFQAVPWGEKNYQIYCMHLKDRLPYMVSTGHGSCTCGFFKPDGSKIIFASSHNNPEPQEEKEESSEYAWELTPYMNIYEANLDGSSLKALTQGPAYHAECAYSPNGDLIVYASNQEGSMNLYVMDSQGELVNQLTHNNHCYNGGPFFSPSGQEVVFRADRDIPNQLQLFIINADGSNERQLTNRNAVNWAPFFHPQGDLIAYTTSIHGHNRYEIYLMNIRTGQEVRLTDSPGFDGLPSFNQEGTKMLWTSKRAGGNCQVFIADFSMPQDLIFREK